MKIVVDTGDDYPEYDNSSEDSSILPIDSSSNDMDIEEAPNIFENIEDQNLIFYIDKRRMTDKTSLICLKINVHIQKLIILQTQKFYHKKRQNYMLI